MAVRVRTPEIGQMVYSAYGGANPGVIIQLNEGFTVKVLWLSGKVKMEHISTLQDYSYLINEHQAKAERGRMKILKLKNLLDEVAKREELNEESQVI